MSVQELGFQVTWKTTDGPGPQGKTLILMVTGTLGGDNLPYTFQA